MKAPNSDLTRIITASFFIIALAAGSAWILSPFLAALIWATTVVVATWNLMTRLEKKIGNRRKTAATIMSLAIAAIILIPLGLAVGAIFDSGAELVEKSKNLEQYKVPPPPTWVAKLPVRGAELSADWQRASSEGLQTLAPKIQPFMKKARAWVIAGVGSVGMFVVHLILTLVLAGLLYARGEMVVRGITMFARRLAGQRGEDAVLLAGKAIKSVALGIIVTALVQTVLAGAGLWLAGVPFLGILTAAVLILCVAQLGPLIPLLAGVAWLYYKGENTTASILLVWSLFVGTFDNVLRPILIKRGANLPFILILAGVIGGLLGFGVMGLFIGPVILAVTYTLLKAWVTEPSEAEEADWPAPTPSYRTDRTMEEQYPTEMG
ncbi:AI-2E family transporter YdiK [Bdellovibrio sp. HCB2-146]|uniref:AI-2E family transporter YdiK n=1 Tax=Bdellovibrio sp. HCB2-146 TaxID=3394362 RepID=UPI0039BD3516